MYNFHVFLQNTANFPSSCPKAPHTHTSSTLINRRNLTAEPNRAGCNAEHHSYPRHQAQLGFSQGLLHCLPRIVDPLRRLLDRSNWAIRDQGHTIEKSAMSNMDENPEPSMFKFGCEQDDPSAPLRHIQRRCVHNATSHACAVRRIIFRYSPIPVIEFFEKNELSDHLQPKHVATLIIDPCMDPFAEQERCSTGDEKTACGRVPTRLACQTGRLFGSDRRKSSVLLLLLAGLPHRLCPGLCGHPRVAVWFVGSVGGSLGCGPSTSK